MTAHDHHDCEHKVAYCSKCDVAYCTICGKEWGSNNWTVTTYPYPDNMTTWDGTMYECTHC